MFDTQENRYITRGVNEQVTMEIQQRCFQLIDEKVKQAEIQLEPLRSRIGKKNHSLLIILRSELPKI